MDILFDSIQFISGNMPKYPHIVSTKTYELVGIFQPKSIENKAAWLSFDQYEATIKDVNPATIDNQMERNTTSHKLPSLNS